jgi:hypothetical protein
MLENRALWRKSAPKIVELTGGRRHQHDEVLRSILGRRNQFS